MTVLVLLACSRGPAGSTTTSAPSPAPATSDRCLQVVNLHDIWVETDTFDARGLQHTHQHAEGRQVTEWWDFVYELDDQDRVVQSDWYGNDEPIERQRWAFAPAGHVEWWEVDRDIDGNAELRETYDADGHPLVREDDYHGDGELDAETTWTWSESGKLTSEVFRFLPDGVPSWRTDYTYDADGLPLSEAYDLGRDGNVESWVLYTHDEDGWLVQIAYDDDEDGITASLDTWMRDDLGRPLEFTSVEPYYQDPSRLSVLEQRTTYDFDSYEVVTEIDWNGDGVLDSRTTEVFTSDGRPTLYEPDWDGVDGINSRTTWTYDEGGRVLEMVEDHLADGTPDYVWTCRYDEDGRLVRREDDVDGQGDAEFHKTREYSCMPDGEGDPFPEELICH